MSEPIPNYYWDTCIFTAHLNDERGQHAELIDHIQQFLEEAAAGKCRIYCSTITIAEITEGSLKRANVGSFQQFLTDLRGAVVPVDPNPIIMGMASHLRSQVYKKGPEGNRSLGTPDAIHLATALGLSDLFSVPVATFHTFDRGRRRGEDGGKGLPLLGYETWCDRCKDDPVVKRVINLNRDCPRHSSPRLVP